MYIAGIQLLETGYFINIEIDKLARLNRQIQDAWAEQP